MLTLKIGSRPSPLAIKQVEEVGSLLPSVCFEVIRIDTRGDKDKASSLAGREDSDFFTREIEEALLEGRIDAAVHSAKDLESVMPRELCVAAITRPVSDLECLVSKNGHTLEKLPVGAVVGTSSRKRKEAVTHFRPDLVVKDIRGNIGERLNQLDDGDFDAVIIAHAALIRLGLEGRITQIIPRQILEPHPLQGSLAIQIRKGRKDLQKIFGSIDAR